MLHWESSEFKVLSKRHHLSLNYVNFSKILQLRSLLLQIYQVQNKMFANQ